MLDEHLYRPVWYDLYMTIKLRVLRATVCPSQPQRCYQGALRRHDAYTDRDRGSVSCHLATVALSSQIRRAAERLTEAALKRHPPASEPRSLGREEQGG